MTENEEKGVKRSIAGRLKSYLINKMRRSWNPIIFRTGLLYDKTITGLLIVPVGLISLAVSILQNSVDHILWDVLWFIVWIGAWVGTAYFVRKAVKGLVCLFDIPDKEYSYSFQISKDNIRSHKCRWGPELSLAHAIATGDDFEYADIGKREIPQLLKTLFDEDDENFANYKKRISLDLFAPWEILVGIMAFIVFFFMWWGPTTTPWFPYSTPGVQVDYFWIVITCFWFVECLMFASFFNVYYAMLNGTRILGQRPKGLRIHKFLQFLDRRKQKDEQTQDDQKATISNIDDLVVNAGDRKGDDEEEDEIVDYEVFRQLIRPIGKVFADVTSGLIAVLIIIDIYWTIYNIFHGVHLEIIPMLYPIFGMGLAFLLFLVPQYSIHRTLVEYKTIIGERLARSRMITSTRLIKGTSGLSSNMKKVDEHLEPFIRLNQTTLDVLDSMTEKLKNASTWTLDTTFLVKIGPVVNILLLAIRFFGFAP